jgi:hypothetical protein
MVKCGRFGAGYIKVSEELFPECESDLNAIKCDDNDSKSGVSTDGNFCEIREYHLFTKHIV